MGAHEKRRDGCALPSATDSTVDRVVALLHAALASKSVNGRVVLKTIAGLLHYIRGFHPPQGRATDRRMMPSAPCGCARGFYAAKDQGMAGFHELAKLA